MNKYLKDCYTKKSNKNNYLIIPKNHFDEWLKALINIDKDK